VDAVGAERLDDDEDVVRRPGDYERQQYGRQRPRCLALGPADWSVHDDVTRTCLALGLLLLLVSTTLTTVLDQFMHAYIHKHM